MIYCGKKSDLENYGRTYLPKDMIIEFPDDGSDKKVRLKTGRMDYAAPYPKLPYVGCDCDSTGGGGSNRYVYNTQEPSDKWVIHHNLKGYPLIQLYDDKNQVTTTYTDPDEHGNRYPITIQNQSDHHINGEIHYIDIDTVEVTFSEPVSGYAICLGIKDNGIVYKGSGSVWLIHHNLGAKPFTQVFDNAGYLINAEIEHIDDNTTRISFYSGRDYDVKDDEEARYGYMVDVKNKTPLDVNGFAVLITDPTASYVHEQTEPAANWEIRHGLNNYVLVQLLDPDLYVRVSEVRQINKSLIRVSFSEPVTGKVICATTGIKPGGNSNQGGVIIVDQYQLPDVAEALTNTIYVIKQTGFAYCTDDNFQWITVTPGPTRIDGNLYKDQEGMEVDGNKWDKQDWEE